MAGPEKSGSVREKSHLDDLFSTLADENRRSVLHYLQSSEDGIATVDELVEHTAEAGSGTEKAQLDAQFHHAILPRLVDVGFIEYDARTQTVRYREVPFLDQILSKVAEVEAPP